MQRFVVVCQRHVHRHRVYGLVVLHPRDIGIRLLNGIDIFACLGKGDVAKARAAFPGNRDLGRIRKRRFDGLTVRARPCSSDGELYLAIVVLQAFALSVILAHLESSAAVQHSAGGGIGIFKDDCLRISGVFPVYPALNLLRLFQRHSSNFKGGLSSPAALRHRNGQLVHRLVIGHSGDRTSWNGFFDEIGIGSRLRKGDGSELACMFRRIVFNGNRRTAAARLSSLGHGWGNTFIIWNPSHRKGKSVVSQSPAAFARHCLMDVQIGLALVVAVNHAVFLVGIGHRHLVHPGGKLVGPIGAGDRRIIGCHRHVPGIPGLIRLGHRILRARRKVFYGKRLSCL